MLNLRAETALGLYCTVLYRFSAKRFILKPNLSLLIVARVCFVELVRIWSLKKTTVRSQLVTKRCTIADEFKILQR